MREEEKQDPAIYIHIIYYIIYIYIIYIHISLKFGRSSCLESANVCLLGFFSVNPGICVSLKGFPKCFSAFFWGIQVSSNAKTSGSRGMWNWTLKRRSNAIFIRQPWMKMGSSWNKNIWGGHFSSRPPLYNKCILFQRKSRKSIKFIFCYAALNRMSLWILLKSMRVLSFYLTLGLPFLGPRVHSNPPPSRTLQPKSPLSAGKGSLLWIGTKAKELGCKLKWPRTPKVRLQKIKCATVIPANPKHSTKRSTSTC